MAQTKIAGTIYVIKDQNHRRIQAVFLKFLMEKIRQKSRAIEEFVFSKLHKFRLLNGKHKLIVGITSTIAKMPFQILHAS